MGNRVCITGGYGFIGGHLAEHLAELGYQVTLYDLVAPNFSLSEQIMFVQGDILDRATLTDVLANQDIVFHFAAMVGVVACLKDPERVKKINEDGTKIVLDISEKQKVSHFFFASSSEIYGEGKPNYFFNEFDQPKPKSVYAHSKMAGENYILKDKGEMNRTILRFCNVYGPRQRQAFVIAKFIRWCLSNKKIEVAGTGEQLRTYTYINDVLYMIDALLNCPDADEKGTFNISSSQPVSLNTLAKTIKILTGSESTIHYFPFEHFGRSEEVEIINRLLSNKKITTICGQSFETGLIAGLADYIYTDGKKE